MVAPRVAVDAARPGRHAGDAEVDRGLVWEHAGVVEPIDDRRVGFDASHQARRARRAVSWSAAASDARAASSERSRRDAARDHEAAEEAIAGEPLVDLLEALLQRMPVAVP